MLTVVDVVYDHFKGTDRRAAMAFQQTSLEFTRYLDPNIEYHVVRHLDEEGHELINGVCCHFFRRNPRSWRVPVKTHRFIRSLDPDVIIVQGLIFPLQAMALKASVRSPCALVLQHHGERPGGWKRLMIQKLADRFVDAYMFTAKGNAVSWIDRKVIRDRSKVYEVQEAGALLQHRNKIESLGYTGMRGRVNFLSVGRLNSSKDPMVILKAFELHARRNADAHLHFIYQENEPDDALKAYAGSSTALKARVHFIGRVDHAALPYWYSAADCFVSSSRSEGSGFALLEAMNCGCLPIVTRIPSFEKITRNGEQGFLYEPGDHYGLSLLMDKVYGLDIETASRQIREFAAGHLHFRNIAEDITLLCHKLKAI